MATGIARTTSGEHQQQQNANCYKGQRLLNQVRHGEGEYIFTNKFFKYKGSWENGIKQGRGRLSLGDGGYYEGSFVAGEMEGHGYRVFGLSGATYSGQFRQGEMDGQGILCTADGCQYEGGFMDNMKEGEGVLTEADGSIYEGSFHENKQHGEGIKMYSNGDKYEGNWVSGKRQGHGELTCENGIAYKGQWCNDLYHGEGTLDLCSGMIYSGIWIKGRPDNETVKVNSILKGSKHCLTLHQGVRFSVQLQCLTSQDYVNDSDYGRVLKLTAWVRSLPEIDAAATQSPSQPRRSSMSQGKLSHFSVLQPTELFKKESAFKTPMGYTVYPYEIFQDVPEASRCQSNNLLLAPVPSLNASEQQLLAQPDQQATAPLVDHSTVPSPMVKGLQSNSMIAKDAKENSIQVALQASSLVLPSAATRSEDRTPQGLPVHLVRTSAGRATFVDLFLPPPPPSQIKTTKDSGIDGADSTILAAKTSSKKSVKGSPSKLFTALQPKRDKYCRPGEYLLMVEDVTEPSPFTDYCLNPCFIPVTVSALQ